ncbi:sensor histidine kinase [Halobacillus litoralis]|uniref:ATP-binding protein n=1 Tax=Halobacillus litoralis TaxID=45668 RepID=UPI001CD7BBD9|nr:sensor histidine kinase [Halobacillus litoralis]MCA0971382.1 sensor histidine kinase [Halobacillus litoralis]
MSLKRMPIRWKITILSFGMVLFTVLIGGIIIIGNTIASKEESLGDRALVIGRTVANLPALKQNLAESEGWETINPMVERIRTINSSDYIVVLDMNRIRYSHPVEDKLGTLSSGKDEGPAFAEHSYTSKAEGELGVAVRAFVPVMDDEHEQIGVVIVGNLLPSVPSILLALKNEILLVLVLTSLFGVSGSWLLARHLKKQTFQLEPHEIVQLLVERTAMFQAMNEGIIAVDNEGTITIMNEKAKSILGLKGHHLNQPVREVVPDIGLDDVLYSEKAVHNEELRLGSALVLSTKVPVRVDDETIGAVIIFQDRTDVTQLAEELTGVKAFVEALRVQNHEHLNKLHTIAGLIQLDQNDQALTFVFETSEKQERLSRFLIKNFKDYSLSGLLLSKVSRGKELGIEVEIDDQSRLNQYPPLLDQHDFVLILGNLVENAFHALEGVDREEKWIDVSVYQDDHVCTISVEDNGQGIPSYWTDKVLEKGFTTKGENGSGIGLHLVKRIVDKGLGEVEIISDEGEGTSVMITFPMRWEEEREHATGH